MNMPHLPPLLFFFWSAIALASENSKLIAEDHDYVPSMRQVAARFKGQEGVVLHLGDSITYANPYSQWARHGRGKTPRDIAICQWMHTGGNKDLDGWHLCSVDRPGSRSETAASGIRLDQYLAGSRQGMLSMEALLKRFGPRMAVLMLGTNDASAQRPLIEYRQDMAKALDLILAQGTIPILSTLPPHPARGKLISSYNDALRQLAKEKKIPLIDFEAEILKRRPTDWNGTLLQKNDVHPSATFGTTTTTSEPTPDNLRNSGYLLRGWLSVQKIAEVKKKVLDGAEKKGGHGGSGPRSHIGLPQGIGPAGEQLAPFVRGI